ncbi:MAG: polymer-forming cytoskeletal protein [Desulfobacterales bacterium]|nr:polymer-forming cytoskeletal protein [Desulfobacterales bacterium]
MKLFGGKKKDKARSGTNNSGAITTILDQETLIAGDLTFKGKARLDGRIEGNIKGDYLIVSDSASVCGDIEAETVVCYGRIDGNVRAEKIQAMATAAINGSLEAKDLAVESGARLSGEIKPHSQELRLVEGLVQARNEG